MKTTDIIRVGDEITTQEGWLTVENICGMTHEFAYCIEWTYDEDGERYEVGERRLTLNDLEHIMKDYDGKNHKVRFDDESEDEDDGEE